MLILRRLSNPRFALSAVLIAAACGLPPSGTAGAAEAADDASTTTVSPGASTPAGALVPRPRKLSPFALELQQAIDAERAALVALQERFDRSTRESEALSIQREIERVKAGGEIQILRIQAKHARLKGREAAARRIEAAVDAMLHPAPAERAVRPSAPERAVTR